MNTISRAALAAGALWAMPAHAAPQMSEAALQYLEYCSVCHGDTGNGQSRATPNLDPPPRDFTHPSAAVELTRTSMIEAVRNGRPGTAMSAWSSQLDQAQIEEIVDYVRDTFFFKEDEALRHGRELYQRNCVTCHGADGITSPWARGELNPPPVDLALATGLSRERMIFSIEHGRPETAMVGWGTRLEDSDIEALADYIRGTLQGGDRGGATAHPPMAGHPAMADYRATVGTTSRPGDEPVDRDAPMPEALDGDPAVGQGLYLANCVPCHGVTGDGNGPRAYFVFPKPRDFTDSAARARFSRPMLYRAIAEGSVGTEMAAWDKVLQPQQIADIAQYLFDAHTP